MVTTTHQNQLFRWQSTQVQRLYEMIHEYGIVWHKKRQEFLSSMLVGVWRHPQVNILCAVTSVGKMAVPIYFDMLDNNSGNSSAEDRISLFKPIIGIIGKTNPVKAKKHGYSQFSVFRRGLKIMRELYKNTLYLDLMDDIIALARSSTRAIYKTVG